MESIISFQRATLKMQKNPPKWEGIVKNPSIKRVMAAVSNRN